MNFIEMLTAWIQIRVLWSFFNKYPEWDVILKTLRKLESAYKNQRKKISEQRKDEHDWFQWPYTDLIWSDLKPLIIASRNKIHWQCLSWAGLLCPCPTGVPAVARKDLSTGCGGLCLSSSCCAVFLSVYFPADSNEELVAQCSNLVIWVCGESMSIFCWSSLVSQVPC